MDASGGEDWIEEASDSDKESQASLAKAAANKNETRMRRHRLAELAGRTGITIDEIGLMASAGMLLPDPFRMLLESDPLKRVQTAESDARKRVQYTNLMHLPRDIDKLLGDDPKPVRIGSKSYLRDEQSLGELMVVVRGIHKTMDAFRRGYEEQHSLLNEVLRLVQEKMVTARMKRSSAPSFLIQFARMLEALGFKRNDLRYADGRFVRALLKALKPDGDDAEIGADAMADRLQSWLAEDDAIASAEGSVSDDEDEFDRLSRVAAKALMSGDLDAARAAFADLEAYDASLDDVFGQGDSDQIDDDLDVGPGVVEASAVGDLAETEGSTTAVTNTRSGSDDANDAAGRALTPEGDGGVRPATDGVPDLVWSDARAKINGAGGKAGDQVDLLSTHRVAPVPSSPVPTTPSTPAPTPVPTPVAAPVPAPVVLPVPPEPAPVPRSGPPPYLTGWAVSVPKDVDHGRATGIGWLPGGDPFGGILSTAASTPEVTPMWDRGDRQASMGDRLTLDDWYRFEVPFGPYALVHMPWKLNDYAPVHDEMFPPYISLERYGTDAGFSTAELRSFRVAEMGRGPMDKAIRAVRSVLIKNYGQDDEDLLRFWMFLLLGRRFMHRIDALFPHGYFHGVVAPDPAARDSGTGFFRIVRVLDDGDLAAQMRTPKFAPFEQRTSSS